MGREPYPQALQAVAILLFLTVAVGLGAQTAPAPASPAAAAKQEWSKLQFLVGNWKGVGMGKPGDGSAVCSFAFDLADHVLIRKNRVELVPAAGEKSGAAHEDLMVIFQASGDTSLRAIYWDNEGHTIRYALSFPADKSVVFESEPSDRGLRFKLTYAVEEPGTVAVEFALAAPGAPYQIYTKGTMIKAK